jgi:hypothetical protein
MMEIPMKKIFASTLLLAMMTAAASAMPLAPVEPAANADVIQVAGGCGAGFHRGPYGGCLQNFANPGAHACPRGFHVGPGGGCRGNGR